MYCCFPGFKHNNYISSLHQVSPISTNPITDSKQQCIIHNKKMFREPDFFSRRSLSCNINTKDISVFDEHGSIESRFTLNFDSRYNNRIKEQIRNNKLVVNYQSTLRMTFLNKNYVYGGSRVTLTLGCNIIDLEELNKQAKEKNTAGKVAELKLRKVFALEDTSKVDNFREINSNLLRVIRLNVHVFQQNKETKYQKRGIHGKTL